MKFRFSLSLLLATFWVGMTHFTYSQNVIMSNTNTTVCGGTFLDPGGLANYGNNLNITMTLCPATIGAFVKLDFTAFNVESNFDFLTIYNGQTTAGATLGSYSGVLPAFSVQSTDPSGCLTFVFQSDGSSNFSGFSANLSCIYPCQTVIANVVSTVPAAVGGYIDICEGQAVTVSGTGSYPNSPGNYTQSNATSNFLWSFGDVTTAPTANATHTYTAAGVYDLDLVITDVNGCTNANDINLKVRVSGPPSFVGTSPTSSDICLGQSNTISGFVQAPTLEYVCESGISEITTIPDGVGVSYTSAIDLDCFNPATTVTSASDIAAICMDLEHSFIHDLDITLTCPNGTTIDLYVTYPGAVNNVQFGQPVDDDLSATLGTPYNYCFTNTATNTIYSVAEPAVGTPPIQNYIDNDGTPVVGGFYIPAGNYLPDQGFGNLIGCPLNGDWTITVTDNLNSDNGTIFNWNIDFAANLYTTNFNFTPSIAANWQPNPDIVSNVGNTITVTPTVLGQNCYVFQSTDQFGCTYDTSICFNVSPADDASFSYAKFQYCKSDPNPTPTITGTPGGVFNATGGLPIQPLTGQIDLTLATVGTYTITYSTPGLACPSNSNVIITILDASANFIADITSGCTPLTVNFTNLSANSVTCNWNFGDGNLGTGCGTVSHTYTNGGIFSPILTITDNNGCSAQFSQSNLITAEPQPQAAFIPSPSELSVNNQTSTMVNTSTGASSYSWVFPGNVTSTATSPSFTFDLTEGETAEVILFAYSAGGCLDSASAIISLTEELIFYAPNAFTPNSDEFNGIFMPIMTQGFSEASYQLTIFDRWGEVVFVSQDIHTGWDGTNRSGRVCQDGVYIYKIEYARKNVDETATFEGHVNLLR